MVLINFKKIIFVVALAISSSMTLANNDVSIVETQDLAKDNYPIKISKQEWKALKDHDAMLSAIKIDDESLAKISTKDLLEVVLDYPLFDDVLAYNSVQAGFDSVVKNYKGLKELLSRSDISKEVLKKYKKIEVNLKKTSLSYDDQVLASNKIRRLEWILSQDVIVDSLSGRDQKTLAKLATENFRSKELDQELYGAWGKQASALLLGKTLLRTNKDNLSTSTQDILQSRDGDPLGVMNELVNISEKLVK